MKRVGVIGLGLMGGSLGLALKRNASVYEVLGYARRAENRSRALELGAVDRVFSAPRELAATCDIIVCCLPVQAIVPVLSECAGSLQTGAVMTDVGSTKQAIVAEMETVMHSSPGEFIGSHPVCGSELEGIEAARDDLYQGATTVITPGPDAGTDARNTLKKLWRAAGSDVIEMSAEAHDGLLARSSHLPHLTAALLAAVVGRGHEREVPAGLCGSGYRDTTRLADGSPAIWKDIVQTNIQAIKNELEHLRDETSRLLDMLESEDVDAVERFLQEARASRRHLLAGGDRE